VSAAIDARHRARLDSGWLYQGPEAAKAPDLTAAQLSYAITLRRQLAERLKYEAQRIAIGNTSPEGRFWSTVGAACRAEVGRCERALQRLADAPMRDAFSDPQVTAAYDARLAEIPLPAAPEPLA